MSECDRCNLIEVGRANHPAGTLGDMVHDREPSDSGATEYLLECSVCERQGVFLRVHPPSRERGAMTDEAKGALETAMAQRERDHMAMEKLRADRLSPDDGWIYDGCDLVQDRHSSMAAELNGWFDDPADAILGTEDPRP